MNFILSDVTAKDGSRFVISLSERKMLGSTEKIKRELMVYDECSTVLIIKRQK